MTEADYHAMERHIVDETVLALPRFAEQSPEHIDAQMAEMARHILTAPNRIITSPVDLDAEQLQRLSAAMLEAMIRDDERDDGASEPRT